ncbi:hypothetical protein EVAR_84561_1 [Eumeta japonica]|uniref:Uncharacterized protein n=1 Tax=Eumeta variegata TaxID=151549 RepID=A0A4C1UHR8_EUMVA|nr:hypothetical protein EVAR_84561_1 [Eumeta japonica]
MKRQCLVDSLHNQCTNSIQPTNQHHLDDVKRIVTQLLDSSLSINHCPVIAEEMNVCIRDLRSQKASGLDVVSSNPQAVTAKSDSAPGSDLEYLYQQSNLFTPLKRRSHHRYPKAWKGAI